MKFGNQFSTRSNHRSKINFKKDHSSLLIELNIGWDAKKCYWGEINVRLG